VNGPAGLGPADEHHDEDDEKDEYEGANAYVHGRPVPAAPLS